MASSLPFTGKTIWITGGAGYLGALIHYGPSGVRFNCVTPGSFPNPAVQAANPVFLRELNRRTALNRVGQNHEIVGPTLFLLGDAST
jgi:NAD(P)-dependent dehydrogenase (short-subunit alcohol dehydrogenase family)